MVRIQFDDDAFQMKFPLSSEDCECIRQEIPEMTEGDKERCINLLDRYRNAAEKEPTVRSEKETGDLCALFVDLGSICQENRSTEEAEALYCEALEVYRKLAKKNPAAYLPWVAYTGEILSDFFLDTDYNGKSDEAEEILREALEIFRTLAKDDPDTYLPRVAGVCSNLGNSCVYGEEEEKLLREAMEIYVSLAEKKPDTYMECVADAAKALGSFFIENDKPSEAEELLPKALAIYRNFKKNGEYVDLSAMAEIERELTWIYWDDNNIVAAIKYAQAAYDHYSEAAKKYSWYSNDRTEAKKLLDKLKNVKKLLLDHMDDLEDMDSDTPDE